jgi:predicted aldo/keto reductase-like oxidoreductase
MAHVDHTVSRRDFLRRSASSALAGGAAAAGIGQSEPVAGQTTAKVALYRQLGRTKLKVSGVSIGAGGLSEPDMVLRAVDLGMNYLDTSICYGRSEDVLGEAVRNDKGLRKKLIIATKWDARHDSTKEQILESLDRSLKRIGTDYIDVMQIHWLGGGHVAGDTGTNRLDNPALYEAMAAARKAGKIRFTGATSHDGNRSRILQYAINKDAFDVILVKMSYLDFDAGNLPALLELARKKNVGVVAMKVQPNNGQIPPGFEGQKWNVFQANIRWALSKGASTVVSTQIGKDARAQDEAVAAAVTKITEADERLLQKYAAALSPEYCRGCAQNCQAACPAGIQIAAVMQFRMYHQSYGWGEYARHLYSALPEGSQWSDQCGLCDICAKACPYDLPVPQRIAEAYRWLA